MDEPRRYEAFVRERITELRERKGVSEHRMSLELGKAAPISGASPTAFPCPLRELFNIMEYFDLTPALFFESLDTRDSPARNCEQKAAGAFG